MNKFITVNDLVSATEEYASGRMIVLYGGRDTSNECVEHFATMLCMRGEWVQWDGSDTAHSEPQVYVSYINPDLGECGIMEYVGALARLFSTMGSDLVNGDLQEEYVPNTGDVLWVDTHASNDKVVLIGITEEYEFFLDNSDESV